MVEMKNKWTTVTGNTRGQNMRTLITAERISDELVSSFEGLRENKYCHV
jgi:hypothetical protein